MICLGHNYHQHVGMHPLINDFLNIDPNKSYMIKESCAKISNEEAT